MDTVRKVNVNVMKNGKGSLAQLSNVIQGVHHMECVPMEPVYVPMAGMVSTVPWRDIQGTVMVMEPALPPTRWDGSVSVKVGGMVPDVIYN